VPNQTMTSAVALGRSIHKEMHFVQGNYPEKIAGGRKVLSQTGPVPAENTPLCPISANLTCEERRLPL
jgi:hypothetical protein